MDFFKRKPIHVYYNNLLEFSIKKPMDWTFVPQKSAPLFKFKHLRWLGRFKHVLARRLVTFVYFYKKHEAPDAPLPTVQCGCRLNYLPKHLTVEELTEKLVEEISRPLQSCQILAVDSDYRISGFPAIFIRMKFLVKSDTTCLQCLGRVVVVPWKEFLIIIGLTGAETGEYRYEAEFEEIIKSVRLGVRKDEIKN